MPESETFLYACMDDDTREVFYASLTEIVNSHALLRSSHPLERGRKIVMIPVPEDWNGKPIKPSDISLSSKKAEVSIIRTEGRGTHHIRIFSDKTKHEVDQIRAGINKESVFALKVQTAGIITTLTLKGHFSLPSAAKVQNAISNIPQEKKLFVIDFNDLFSFDPPAMAVLCDFLHGVIMQGGQARSLLTATTETSEKIRQSRLRELAPFHRKHDSAAADLLHSMLE